MCYVTTNSTVEKLETLVLYQQNHITCITPQPILRIVIVDDLVLQCSSFHSQNTIEQTCTHVPNIFRPFLSRLEYMLLLRYIMTIKTEVIYSLLFVHK